MREDPLEVTVLIDPYTAEDVKRQYVQCCLVLTTTSGYPSQPASVHLEELKGLGDSRRKRLQSILEEEAISLAGEMMLGQLCESARSTLTGMNCPEGDCAICLDLLIDDQTEELARQDIQKLPCYHCFHLACFAAWYASEQHKKKRCKEDLIREQSHAVSQEMLRDAGLLASKNGLFAVLCPICRAQVAPSYFCNMELKRLAAESKRVAEEKDSHKTSLPSQEILSHLTLMQEQRDKIFARQAAMVPAP